MTTSGRPRSLSAITLGVTDMARSWDYYRALGFEVVHGDRDGPFTSLAVGESFLNLQLVDATETGWGRAIVHVDDVDAMHARIVAAGYRPTMAPSDAPWGERYFHVHDPDGHELSFARPL